MSQAIIWSDDAVANTDRGMEPCATAPIDPECPVNTICSYSEMTEIELRYASWLQGKCGQFMYLIPNNITETIKDTIGSES